MLPESNFKDMNVDPTTKPIKSDHSLDTWRKEEDYVNYNKYLQSVDATYVARILIERHKMYLPCESSLLDRIYLSKKNHLIDVPYEVYKLLEKMFVPFLRTGIIIEADDLVNIISEIEQSSVPNMLRIIRNIAVNLNTPITEPTFGMRPGLEPVSHKILIDENVKDIIDSTDYLYNFAMSREAHMYAHNLSDFQMDVSGVVVKYKFLKFGLSLPADSAMNF